MYLAQFFIASGCVQTSVSVPRIRWRSLLIGWTPLFRISAQFVCCKLLQDGIAIHLRPLVAEFPRFISDILRYCALAPEVIGKYICLAPFAVDVKSWEVPYV